MTRRCRSQKNLQPESRARKQDSLRPQVNVAASVPTSRPRSQFLATELQEQQQVNILSPILTRNETAGLAIYRR